MRGLADRSPLPVSLELGEGRHPESVESGAYFVVSEALANIAKHAGAHCASVSIQRENGKLIVQVHDDGVGGASEASGTGLRGLADRVGAQGGRLTVVSPPGAGTQVRAEIPCAS